MSNSPIFDQLVKEFSEKGQVYDEFVRWSSPAFRWITSEQLEEELADETSFEKKRMDYFSNSVADEEVVLVKRRPDPRFIEKLYTKPKVDGLHSTTEPLSERNSAQPME